MFRSFEKGNEICQSPFPSGISILLEALRLCRTSLQTRVIFHLCAPFKSYKILVSSGIFFTLFRLLVSLSLICECILSNPIPCFAVLKKEMKSVNPPSLRG